MIRLVLDTNVVASGLLWPGTSAQIIETAIEGRITLVTSTTLLAVLAKILRRAKFAAAIAQRIRLDCDREAIHNLNRLLDEPG